jgi:hypothetical protein
MITLEDLYKGTNNGLNIILLFYPQARETAFVKNKPFKIRPTDDTPSAFIKEIKGVWRLTDFGETDQSRSPIDIAMQELNMKFGECVYYLAQVFNISGDVITLEKNFAKIERRPATDAEPDGFFGFKQKESFTEKELKTCGLKVKQEHLNLLNWMSLEYYSRTKMDEEKKMLMTTVVRSTDDYPIFMRNCRWVDTEGKEQSFYKIYQPLNPKKEYRFFYHGTKPQKYINGLFELKKQYDSFNRQLEKEQRAAAGEDSDNFIYKFSKLPEAFICSGERDAMCVKAFNFSPLWFNSETYNLSDSEYFEMTKYVERIYSIPDIDETGIRRGIMLGMKFLDIYTVWLPEKLRQYRDARNKPRKDLRDFTEIWTEKSDFNNLLNLAMPSKFWEYVNEKGRKRLEINTEWMFHFLKVNGFVTLEDKNAKSGKMFVKIENNVVRKIDFAEIQAFLRKFVRDRFMPIDIRNLVNNSARISESTMSALDMVDIDFTDYTPNSQFFFFKNQTWEVTPDKVFEHKAGNFSHYVWADEVIPHDVRRLEPAFDIWRDEDGEWDIKINSSNKSSFLKVLINTSRIHWRKELEVSLKKSNDEEASVRFYDKKNFVIDSPNLDDTEILEQKQHLINKIFAFGYILHRHKSEHRAWLPFAMDNKIAENDDSNGGSGKSFVMKVPRLFMNSVTLSGRNPRITENNHIYENVSKHTDYILIDDADRYLPFGFFFDSVTGEINVNPKFTRSYSIPFEDAPKMAISSNYTLNRFDPSTERRILYMVFSDWYHEKTADNDYLETRTIFDDFGKDLYRNKYTEEEWNDDINVLVDCVRFYLSTIEKSVKINPPMKNVTARNLRTVMGDMFFEWAQVYFAKNSENCNEFIPKSKALEDFASETKQNKWTMNKFSHALKAYCKDRDYIIALNPIELCNSDRRIIKKYEGKSTEMIYVQTKKELIDILDTNQEVPF